MLTLGTMLSLAQCTSGPPPAPGSADYLKTEKPIYSKGYYRGVEDGKRNLEASHERYYQEYTSATETAFEKGYDHGFEAGQNLSVTDRGGEEAAYQRGLEAGVSDAQMVGSPLPSRHSDNYTPATEASFKAGYRAGFIGVRKKIE